jgi:RHS repeat-associated protein
MQAFSLKSTHDPSNPLIHATHPDKIESFSYDSVGNRLPGVYDGANRLLEDDEYTYEYDANGNLIKKVEKATGKTTTYQYDAENQLIRVDLPDGTYATYRYDGLGRRIEKNVNGKITRYVYDNEDIILEYDGENRLVAEYLHGPGIDEPIRMERNGEVYYFIPDAFGSIRALVDTQGYIRQMYEYDAFGEIVQVLDEEGASIPIEDAIPNPYTFTGREYDPETGLYYYRARYYDPSLGRFLQEDPLLEKSLLPDSFWRGLYLGPSTTILFSLPHPYTYVRNNPVNWIDPFGLIEEKRCYENPALKECLKEVQKFREDCAESVTGMVAACLATCIPIPLPAKLVCIAGCGKIAIGGYLLCIFVAEAMEAECYRQSGKNEE